MNTEDSSRSDKAIAKMIVGTSVAITLIFWVVFFAISYYIGTSAFEAQPKSIQDDFVMICIAFHFVSFWMSVGTIVVALIVALGLFMRGNNPYNQL